MLTQWKPMPLDPPFRMAESAATTGAELLEDMVDFWIEALNLDADEITVAINVAEGVLEAPSRDNVQIQLYSPFLHKEFGYNPYDREAEPDEYARQDFELHREVANKLREAFDRPEVLALYQQRPRPIFTQHRWDQPDTKYPVEIVAD